MPKFLLKILPSSSVRAKAPTEEAPVFEPWRLLHSRISAVGRNGLQRLSKQRLLP